MLDLLIDKIDKTEIIANMIFISFWVISIIAIVTAMCQFSNKLSCRIISTLCSLLIVALTFFNEKSSDIGYKVLYNKSQEAREELYILYLYINSNEAIQISRDKVVKDIASINLLLPNVYVPNFIVSLFSFTLVFAGNNQASEQFFKEIERAKTKLNKYFDKYSEFNKKFNETGEKLTHQNSSHNAIPNWTSMIPRGDEKYIYFVGISGDNVASEKLAKKQSIADSRLQVIQYYGKKIKYQIETINTNSCPSSHLLDPTSASKEFEKQLSENVAKFVRAIEIYTEKWKIRSKYRWKVYTLCSVPKEIVKNEIRTFLYKKYSKQQIEDINVMLNNFE